MQSASADSVVGRAGASGAPRGSFFLYAHCCLLLIVVLGFGPTYFLRPVFHPGRPLPGALYAHGAVLTGWFSLVVLQGWLARMRRYELHRQLGYAVAAFAAAVIVAGIVAVRMMNSQIDSPADGENIIVWGNSFTLLMYATFVVLAVVFRRNADAHRRLVLLASMSIVGPALARLPRWPVFELGPDADRNFAIAGLLLMFAALVAHDLVARRRIHPASLAGMIAILAGLAAAVFLGVTGIGYHLLHS